MAKDTLEESLLPPRKALSLVLVMWPPALFLLSPRTFTLQPADQEIPKDM